MVGLELVRDRQTREPATTETAELVAMATRAGVILIPAGTYGNVIRFLPPLVISDAELDEGLEVVEHCLEVLNARIASAGVLSAATT